MDKHGPIASEQVIKNCAPICEECKSTMKFFKFTFFNDGIYGCTNCYETSKGTKKNTKLVEFYD